ncbi:hypothetical protein Pmani_003427 [Petrolisthes manimaculis]|uniref:Uncharacterized protein n=1 Tax=Petrolisthes manimaculis TaxID=1843537 RepID=A0AAE1QFM4_9EUCA|nr:hypothetical protein Pmani_003427 [Petrolisthes manimaculis]
MVVTVVSSGLVTTGAWTVHGFSALSLPQLTTPNSTLYLHPNQASWFATVTLLMGVPGSMVGGVLCEWMGPRRLQLVTSPLLCLTYLALHLVSWPSVRLNISPWPLLMVIRVTQVNVNTLINNSVLGAKIRNRVVQEVEGADLKVIYTRPVPANP